MLLTWAIRKGRRDTKTSGSDVGKSPARTSASEPGASRPKGFVWLESVDKNLSKLPPVLGTGAVVSEIVETVGDLVGIPTLGQERPDPGPVDLPSAGSPAPAEGTVDSEEEQVPRIVVPDDAREAGSGLPASPGPVEVELQGLLVRGQCFYANREQAHRDTLNKLPDLLILRLRHAVTLRYLGRQSGVSSGRAHWTL
jgi:hypothetical protein